MPSAKGLIRKSIVLIHKLILKSKQNLNQDHVGIWYQESKTLKLGPWMTNASAAITT